MSRDQTGPTRERARPAERWTPATSRFPDSASEAAAQAADSRIGTVHSVALDFAAQLPLLCGVIVLFLPWGVVALFRRSADRLLARTELRGSLRKLIERLSVIAIWASA